jgi:hypothetical protein
VSSASVAARPDAVVIADVQRRSWLPLVAGAVAVVARVVTGPHPIDDAFITFRYARNLAEGLGLVYNPGEWVLGTTAPLWALVLAAAYRLGDLPWVALCISALCDAASAMLVARLALAMGWSPRGATLVGLAWALNPMSIAFAAGGMETSAFILVSLGVLSLAPRTSAAVIAGASTLLRPEGALLAFTVIAYDVYARGRFRWRPLLGAAVQMLLAGAILFVVYGSPLPHSVAAKQVAYTPAAPFENTLALLLQASLPAGSTFLASVLPAHMTALLAVVGLMALLVLGRGAPALLERERLPWVPFAMFGALVITFYASIGLRGVRLFTWYAVPLIPLYLLLASAGLRALSRRTWLPALLLAWQVAAVDWHQPFLPLGDNLVREQVYVQVGNELTSALPKTATVAAPEIGALGYTSGLRMLDTVGLVSPASLAYYPVPPEALVTDNAIPAALIEAQRPDAVVSPDAYIAHTLLQDPVFLRDYQVVERRAFEVWQSHELLVFRRVAP